MSSNYSESEDNDGLAIIFPTKQTFNHCIPENDENGGSQTVKTNVPRIDELALPTTRHLIASGIFAMKNHNKRHLNNLEKLLCARFNEGAVNIPAEEYQNRLEYFIAKHRPRTPVDPYKFSTDDIDQPIFYEKYEKRSSTIILKSRVYNFRGIPQPIPSKVLNYRPSKRIIELAKPRRPKRLLMRLSFIQRARLCSVATQSTSDSDITNKVNISKPDSPKSNKHKPDKINPNEIKSDSAKRLVSFA